MWDARNFSIFSFGNDKKKQRNISLLHFSISFQNHFTKNLLKTGRLPHCAVSIFSISHLKTALVVILIHLGSMEKRTKSFSYLVQRKLCFSKRWIPTEKRRVIFLENLFQDSRTGSFLWTVSMFVSYQSQQSWF